MTTKLKIITALSSVAFVAGVLWLGISAWTIQAPKFLANTETETVAPKDDIKVSIIDEEKKKKRLDDEKLKVDLLETKRAIQASTAQTYAPGMETDIYFAELGLSGSESGYLDAVSEYIKNAKLQNVNWLNYKVLTTVTKGCDTTPNVKELVKYSVFDDAKGTGIYGLYSWNKSLDDFKKRKIYVLVKSLDLNCASQATVWAVAQTFGSRNDNITFLLLPGIGDKEKDYVNTMAFAAGSLVLNLKAESDITGFLNDKLYPLAGYGDAGKNFDDNVVIKFFDENSLPTEGRIQVFQKKQGVYSKIVEKKEIKEFRQSLVPGTYTFKITDPVKGLQFETDPASINDALKYIKSVYFRTTKVKLTTMNEDRTPLLADFKLYDSADYLVGTFNQTSSVMANVNPGRYRLEIVATDGSRFSDGFKLFGEETLSREYINKKAEVGVLVTDKDDNQKEAVVVRVTTEKWAAVANLQGGNTDVKLTPGTYVFTALDQKSGTTVSKNVVVSSQGAYNVVLKFETFPVKIIYGSQPRVTKIWSADDYAKREKDKSPTTPPIKQLSGTNSGRIDLFKWKYVAEIYDFKLNKLGSIDFQVDDFFDNELNLSNGGY